MNVYSALLVVLYEQLLALPSSLWPTAEVAGPVHRTAEVAGPVHRAGGYILGLRQSPLMPH